MARQHADTDGALMLGDAETTAQRDDSAEQIRPAEAVNDGVEIQTTTGTVLLMDDNAAIREVVGNILASAGYRVLPATNGHEAIALYSEYLAQGKAVDCLILDLSIPRGMGGKNTMEAILRLNPRAKGIVSSGHTADPVVTDYQKHGFAAAINKPFKMEELLAVVHRVLAAKPD